MQIFKVFHFLLLVIAAVAVAIEDKDTDNISERKIALAKQYLLEDTKVIGLQNIKINLDSKILGELDNVKICASVVAATYQLIYHRKNKRNPVGFKVWLITVEMDDETDKNLEHYISEKTCKPDKDRYDAMSNKNRAIYNAFNQSCKALTCTMDVSNQLVKKRLKNRYVQNKFLILIKKGSKIAIAHRPLYQEFYHIFYENVWPSSRKFASIYDEYVPTKQTKKSNTLGPIHKPVKNKRNK